MPWRKKVAGDANDPGSAVTSITYPAKRKNIPPAGLNARGNEGLRGLTEGRTLA